MSDSAPTASPLAPDPDERLVSGWGRTAASRARVLAPGSVEEVADLVRVAGPRGVLARGLGRSYGDSAQDGGGTLLSTERLTAARLDAAGGTVTCGSGASIDDLLRLLVPAGFFVPVTPGTRFVTVGGAIAADVHGKNHHVDGTFGSHVRSLELVDGTGAVRTLSPDADADAFWATVGGMGLTGVVTAATVAVPRIETAAMRVDTVRARDLDEVMAHLVEGDGRYRYTVAWVDSVAGGAATGRGVVTSGEHARLDDLPASRRSDPLAYSADPRLAAPPIVPGGLLNRWTVRAFNEAWFRKAPAARADELQSIPQFFHPLDGVRDWNRIYGPRGFVQYQFVVPDSAGDVVRVALERLRAVGAPSFLTVLKRFGPANPSPLSFPRPGWTLALDLPAGVEGLPAVLDELDEVVLAAGGALYLAKDARATAATVAASYPRLDAWRAVRDRLDPAGVFVSDQARRLDLLGRAPAGAGQGGTS